jgi:glycogen synthase
MRIAFLTTEYPSSERPDGGLASHVQRTARALVRRGHEVSVISFSSQERRWNDGGVDVAELTYPRIPAPLHRFALTLPLLQALSSRKAVRALLAEHRTRPFDVIEATNYFSPALMLSWTSRGRKVALITRLSTYTPLWRSHHDIGTAISDRLELMQLRAADAVFAPSRLIAELAARRTGVAVTVVRPPPPLAPLSEDSSFIGEYGLEAHSFLLFVGRISRMKGIDLLLEAMPDLLERFPRLRLVIVGRDEGGAGQPIDRCVRERFAEWPHRVIHHKTLDRSRLWPLLRNARGVVVPSRVDNYPNVASEAISLGTPVVASRNSSLDEIVRDNENGTLFENGSAVDLRERLEWLIRLDARDYGRMRERTMNSASGQHDDSAIANLELLYRTTIRSRQNHEPRS